MGDLEQQLRQKIELIEGEKRDIIRKYEERILTIIQEWEKKL